MGRKSAFLQTVCEARVNQPKKRIGMQLHSYPFGMRQYERLKTLQ
ncbi:hypothetical protein SABR111722_20705 [Saccharibacillus brassicae]